MNLLDLASILRAAADRAEERHLASEERKAALEAAKAQLTAQDVATVIAHVGKHPGSSSGEVLGALEAQGLSRPRAETALSEAKRTGSIVATRDGSALRHHIRGSANGK